MRIIVVPKDSTAEASLNYNRQTDDQIIEYFLSKKEANILYNIGIFDCINTIANTLIDDFEEDLINDQKDIGEILRCLIEVRDRYKEPFIKDSVSIVIKAFTEAHKRKVGIYFYF